MKPALIVLAVLAAAFLGRTKLVDILTKTTGTWVGSPSLRS
jgi:hypothetical protein